MVIGQVGKVEKIYRWTCGCGAIHESKEEPIWPLHCGICGGQNGGVGQGKAYTYQEPGTDGFRP